MNIIKIETNNQVNGPGLRCVIWCAGCSHHCEQCHNPETWNPNQGHLLSEEDYAVLRSQLSDPAISGVTFSGGEATFITNIVPATQLMQWIKTNYPTKTIWVYSGYHYEEIKDFKMFDYIDVLIDGPYEHWNNPGIGQLKWRGSSNQRVIDIKKTRESNTICEYIEINGKTITENELEKA